MSIVYFSFCILMCIAPSISYSSFDYCSLDCYGRKHVMCEYPEGGGKECSAYEGGLSPEEKEVALAQHNLLRQKVANGEEKRGPQPPAADMNELTWNNELAEIAQRWADQCKENGMARCSRTRSSQYVGQNMFILDVQARKVTKEQALKYAVNYWSQGVVKFSPSLIKKFNVHDNFEDTGRYSQIVWSTTTRLGCGVSMKKEGSNTHFKVVCNYQPGGKSHNDQMYKEGTACSACPKGRVCSKKYPGLCARG